MDKASVSNISVLPRFCHHPESSCYGLFVGCSWPVHDPSFLLLLVLSACTVTATGAGTLLPHHPPRSSVPFSVTPSDGFALPPCLVSNPLDLGTYRCDRMSMVTNLSPQGLWFSLFLTITHPQCHRWGFYFCFF